MLHPAENKRYALRRAVGHHVHEIIYTNDEAFTNAIATALTEAPCLLYESGGVQKPYFIAPEDNTLWLSLCTATCYRQSVADSITTALSTHMKLAESALLSNINIALHEAIINAVIHGNLAVSDIPLNLNNFSEYYQWIESKLEVPMFARSRIHIGCTLTGNTLMLEVIDEGNGYNYQNYLREDAKHPAHKGLRLIQSSCMGVIVLGKGNHIQMLFME